MIHLGGAFDTLDAADHIETRGLGRSGSAQRNGAQIDQVLHLFLGILNSQVVGIAVARIDPQAGGDHLVRSQRGDDVGDNFFLTEPEFARPHAVDVELQRRLIEILRDEYVGHAVDLPDLAREIEREFVVALKIRDPEI